MAGLKVPGPYRRPLQEMALIALGGADVVEALRSLPDIPTPADVANALEAGLRDSLVEDAQGLAEALVSLASQQAEWSSEELARMIGESDSLELEPAARTALSDQLLGVLSLAPIARAGRGINVLSEQQNMLTRARIMSDVRPLFEEDATELPRGAVILHTLVLDFKDGRSDETLVVALDRTDLESLRDGVARALDKDDTLRRWLAAAGVNRFDVEVRESS